MRKLHASCHRPDVITGVVCCWESTWTTIHLSSSRPTPLNTVYVVNIFTLWNWNNSSRDKFFVGTENVCRMLFRWLNLEEVAYYIQNRESFVFLTPLHNLQSLPCRRVLETHWRYPFVSRWWLWGHPVPVCLLVESQVHSPHWDGCWSPDGRGPQRTWPEHPLLVSVSKFSTPAPPSFALSEGQQRWDQQYISRYYEGILLWLHVPELGIPTSKLVHIVITHTFRVSDTTNSLRSRISNQLDFKCGQNLSNENHIL